MHWGFFYVQTGRERSRRRMRREGEGEEMHVRRYGHPEGVHGRDDVADPLNRHPLSSSDCSHPQTALILRLLSSSISLSVFNESPAR